MAPCSPPCGFREDMKWDGAGIWTQAMLAGKTVRFLLSLFGLTLLAMSLRNLKEILEDWVRRPYEWHSLMSYLRLLLPAKKWPAFAG